MQITMQKNAKAVNSIRQIQIKHPNKTVPSGFSKFQVYLAPERGQPCSWHSCNRAEFSSKVLADSTARGLRIHFRGEIIILGFFFQHLHLDQPLPMGTCWMNVMTTRPTATVEQVMTSSSQVQKPSSSHCCAISVHAIVCRCQEQLINAYSWLHISSCWWSSG